MWAIFNYTVAESCNKGYNLKFVSALSLENIVELFKHQHIDVRLQISLGFENKYNATFNCDEFYMLGFMYYIHITYEIMYQKNYLKIICFRKGKKGTFSVNSYLNLVVRVIVFLSCHCWVHLHIYLTFALNIDISIATFILGNLQYHISI